MELQTINIKGEEFVVIPRAEYDRITGATTIPLPPLPSPDKKGNVLAIPYMRASLARKIITRMNAAGLSQAELARRSRVPAETINRILKCKRSPDESTIKKIERALDRA